MTKEKYCDAKMKFHLENISFTKTNQLQVVLRKTYDLKEEDILRFIKGQYEDMIATIDEIEQYEDVTILLMNVNPTLIDVGIKQTIKEYKDVEFFGSAIDSH